MKLTKQQLHGALIAALAALEEEKNRSDERWVEIQRLRREAAMAALDELNEVRLASIMEHR